MILDCGWTFNVSAIYKYHINETVLHERHCMGFSFTVRSPKRIRSTKLTFYDISFPLYHIFPN